MESFAIRLRSRSIFGAQENLLPGFPSIIALKEGLDLHRHNSFSIFSLFNDTDHVTSFLATTWASRFIYSWLDIIPIFDVVTSAGPVFENRETNFMAALFRFFHCDIENCRSFVQTATGSRFLPLRTMAPQKIKVCAFIDVR